MEYSRFEPSDSARFTERLPPPKTSAENPRRRHLYVALIVLVLVILLVSTTVLVVHVTPEHKHHRNDPLSSPSPSPVPVSSSMLTTMCGNTQFPNTCVNTLRQHFMNPSTNTSTSSTEGSIPFMMISRVVEASQNVTEDRLKKTYEYLAQEMQGIDKVKESLQWAAHDDCLNLIEDSLQLLGSAPPQLLSSLSLDTFASTHQISTSLDIMTLMTTTCSNHATCMEGFEEAYGPNHSHATNTLQDLSEIVSNHIVLSSFLLNNDTYAGSSSRRLIESTHMSPCPKWLSTDRREILEVAMTDIPANITVSLDGVGSNLTVKTIREAIELAPKDSPTPFIIHVKAGRYQEHNLIVDKKKQNVWLIGDGKGKTIITGHKSFHIDNVTTFKTASFGALGPGFVARGITFENTAGPVGQQAVALLVKSDHSVFYECEMLGYQDTLYTHSNRQFYRNCDIYGTVDFIFGNAQAVFQNCSIYARRPMEKQKNTITAQRRKCPNSTSGIIIHECQIRAAPDLEPVKSNYSTYLGRPWNPLSTVVYMLSYIGDHVHPKGWLPWNSETPLPDSVYYAEFRNNGPGANTTQRALTQGIDSNMSVDEAGQFTVDHFLGGSSWFPRTSVPFDAGLEP